MNGEQEIRQKLARAMGSSVDFISLNNYRGLGKLKNRERGCGGEEGGLIHTIVNFKFKSASPQF